MIRIFITAILYLITMFTQAQEKPLLDKEEATFHKVLEANKKGGTISVMQDEDYCRFQQSKFEVKDKELTFDRR
ncbi:hypothetical protein [Lutimonas sp.]|uniref:hypothetical protein n=1 Tax=Lutimonas sp. TaxID=1872403 RepID=UPI003D9BBDC8